MPEFKPTAEQEAIIAFSQNETSNLAVVARAGAAKTSTLVMIAEALPSTQILCLAFNKKIAEEMTQRLPDNCTAKTLHGIGYGAWSKFLGKRLKVDGRKIFFLLKEKINQLAGEDRDEAYDSMSETLDIISTGKSQGWLPERYKGHWKPLLDDYEFFVNLPMEPTALQEELVRHVSEVSFREALNGSIDFDDMILCPALCKVSWPTFPLTMVDESQDLSSLNHYVLRKIVKRNRMIAVGDPLQAIYGFRGARENSMFEMIEKFEMRELHLTTSFRCGSNIIKNAHWRAPDMTWPEWAKEGEVKRLASWEAADVENGDAIICRNNAPLFSIAIKLIQHNKLPEIAGRDIAAPLLKLMKKLGSPSLVQQAALAAVDEWQEKELKRARDGGATNIRDKAEIIRIMLRQTKTLGDASAYLEHLLQRDGRIYLMTGHKSKGLEFDRVWFLDQHLCNLKYGQDANIKYVVETRAKLNLNYVTSDTFNITDEL